MNALARDGVKLSPRLAVLALLASLAGCDILPFAPSPSPSAGAPATPAAAPATAPPIQPIPFEESILKAANDLFAKAQIPAAGSGGAQRYPLVIDPLVDGVTGTQSTATQTMEARIKDLVRTRFPQFEVQKFTTSNIAGSPIVLVGTFTPINNAGQASGPRDAYRVCLALADLKSGKIISKGVARSSIEGVDSTPLPYFRESPIWVKDPATEGYIKTCQGTKPGDPIDPVYADRILAAALLNDALTAFQGRRYEESLDLYASALRTPGGDQLRAYNGIYLCNWKLGRKQDASQAFGRLVDYGLANNRLAVRFLFSPGSTQFLQDAQVSGAYPLWLKQISQRASQTSACLEVVGHTSRTGPEPINERLSVLRAQYIKQRLASAAPGLDNRTIATGVGSRENLVGTGADDASDALDRRVEFKVINC